MTAQRQKNAGVVYVSGAKDGNVDAALYSFFQWIKYSIFCFKMTLLSAKTVIPTTSKKQHPQHLTVLLYVADFYITT
jgi:thiamine pyrophosphokinase